MKVTNPFLTGVLGVGLLLSTASSGVSAAPSAVTVSPVEPKAGGWRTWVLSSGSQFRVPPPPDLTSTASELAQLESGVGRSDAASRDRIAYWDTGAPGYRWNGVLRDEIVKHGGTTVAAANNRSLSLLDVAVYDATVAVWDSKYVYN